MGNNLASQIADARETRGWTQQQLADKAGIDRSHLANIEGGRKLPSHVVLMRIARLLDLDLNKLKAEIDPDAPTELYDDAPPREVA